MERHIQRTQIPTIFIFSDVHEGNHRPEDLERLFPTQLLNSPSVQMVPIHPVTKSKMKKCLQYIAKAELTEKGGGSYSPSAEDYEDMHLASGGDLRHAIFAMQFRYCCSSRSITTSVGRTGHDDGNDSSTKKDAKLSTFHALGKLLYAKRKQPPSRVVAIYSDDEESTAVTSNPATANIDILSKWDDGRGPLEFIPEDVLSRIDMGIGPALSFLSYHSPDFFTDITDMCRSYDLLSDAVLFVDRFTGQQCDGPFPDEYASCIGGRAVADANKHPAPPQFRQLSAPKVFSVMKKSRENEAKIELLRKRLSMVVHNGGGGGGQERTSIHNTIGSAHQFITDSLPYMRTVIPQGMRHSCKLLDDYSLFRL
jgi:cell cycle checkpoint protein